MAGVRVVLVENHTLVRAGIRALLEQVQGIEVVGEAGDGWEALKLIEALQPDVAMVDVAMEGMNGLEVAARTRGLWPGVRILMLSMYASEQYVGQAMSAGAVGYLLKDASQAELEQAIRAAMRGERFLSSRISQQAVEAYIEQRNSESSPFTQLTSRQREVLQLIAEGRTTQEIAGALKISVKTVEAHRAQIMERLGIFDVPGLVRYAIRMGFISPDE